MIGEIVRGIAEGIEKNLGISIEYSLLIGAVIVIVALYYLLKWFKYEKQNCKNISYNRTYNSNIFNLKRCFSDR